MADKYVLLVNDGLYHSDSGKNMGTLADWKAELLKWNDGAMVFTLDGDVESEIDELLSMLLVGCVECFSAKMVERGDDFVELELVKLAE